MLDLSRGGTWTESSPGFTADVCLINSISTVSPADAAALQRVTRASGTQGVRTGQAMGTAPLKGLWQHAPYFHNGTAPTLDAVVQTYNTRQSLGLTAGQMSDLTEYLKSL